MDDSCNKPWEVYALIDPRDNKVRYVGVTTQGIKKRFNEHNKQVRDGELTYKANWIRSLWRNGLNPKIAVLESGYGDSFRDAEIWWIQFFRDFGVELTNLTDGGDGAWGRVHSAEARLKMSKSATARWDRIGRKPPEVRRSRSIAAKEAYENNPDLLAKRSETAKRNWLNDSYRKTVTDSITDRCSSESHKQIISERNRLLWADPQYKEKVSRSIRESLSDPETKELKSKISIEFCSRPEVKQRRSISQKQSWLDPEKRKKRSEGMKEAWRKRKEAKKEII